jgi:hypothetical protein
MDLHKLDEMPPSEWPESTAGDLLGILKNRRAAASDRLLAAELAGDYTVINDDIAAALLAIVSSADEPEDLRGAAAIAFGAALEGADTFEFDDPDEVPISERMFHRVQERFHALFHDAGVPTEVRRRILEASVRAPQEWHAGAIHAAYAGSDDEWKLTAVFGMAQVPGFEKEIVEALGSRNEDIEYEAVNAASAWSVEAAWPKVLALLKSDVTDKTLLLAAIDAAASIRPDEAPEVLAVFLTCSDEEIVDAAQEAIMMAEGLDGLDDDDDDLDGDGEDENGDSHR